ncbi:unnamed protein product, partial [Thlaspi arvense]
EDKLKINVVFFQNWSHWGLSGPVILRLSPWGAPHLFSSEYKAILIVDFILDINIEAAKSTQAAKHKVSNSFPPQFGLVNKFWNYILYREGSSGDTLWASLSKSSISNLLKHCTFQVTGKGQYKDEFVTAGGVPLSEDFFEDNGEQVGSESFLCRRGKHGYNVLNVYGVTGGFNFQNA